MIMINTLEQTTTERQKEIIERSLRSSQSKEIYFFIVVKKGMCLECEGVESIENKCLNCGELIRC